jgi:hypothetical protein
MEKSLAASLGAITILPSEAAAGFSLSPDMPDRKPRGKPRRPAPAARRVTKQSAPAKGRARGGHSVAADSFYKDLVWNLRNGVLAITRDGRVAVMN